MGRKNLKPQNGEGISRLGGQYAALFLFLGRLAQDERGVIVGSWQCAGEKNVVSPTLPPFSPANWPTNSCLFTLCLVIFPLVGSLIIDANLFLHAPRRLRRLGFVLAFSWHSPRGGRDHWGDTPSVGAKFQGQTLSTVIECLSFAVSVIYPPSF